MKAKEKSVKKLEVKAVLDYIEKAKKAGRSEDIAFSDYLVEQGFGRPEDNEAFMQKFREENRELTERIMNNLEQMRQIVHAAQKKYAGV